MKLQQIQANYAPMSEPVQAGQTGDKEQPFWGKDGFTFGDVLDMLNPLHHLPVISQVYRENSQDDACEGSKIIGGALFGGLLGGVTGVISSLANSAIRHETRHDVSEHLVAMVDDSLSTQPFQAVPGGGNVNDILNRRDINDSSNNESNPFFAHILPSLDDEESYSAFADVASRQRITDWGKV